MYKYQLHVPNPGPFISVRSRTQLKQQTRKVPVELDWLEMELELGLAPPCSDLKNANLCCRKRSFHEMKTTLPLFMQKDDDNDGGGSDGDDSEAENLQGINLGARVVVGWPPVKLSRWNSGEDCRAGGGKRTNCVKVYMEGMAIGRKVDLSLHHSYEALFHTLNLMFPKKHYDGEEDEGYYKVTYEDEDGDWMLIGDVPWEAFIQSVKRLKILN